MPRYEYKVVPAPSRGIKAKGLKTAEARFSHAIEALMNQMAGEGWEYQRAETLPSVERAGLASTTTEWRNVLVFRRLRENDADAFAPELLPPPGPAMGDEMTADTDQPGLEVPHEDVRETEADATTAPEETAAPDDPDLEAEKLASTGKGALSPPATSRPEDDNGVEDTGDVKGIGASLMALASKRGKAKSDG